MGRWGKCKLLTVGFGHGIATTLLQLTKGYSIVSNGGFEIFPTLIKKGCLIKYYDPTGSKKEFSKFKNIDYCSNIKEACKNSDLLVIHTEWNEFKQLNFKNIVKKKKFKIYDMRNLYSPSKMKKNKIDYFCIGR